jgi:Swiss Army Knife RNA repair-like protein
MCRPKRSRRRRIAAIVATGGIAGLLAPGVSAQLPGAVQLPSLPVTSPSLPSLPSTPSLPAPTPAPRIRPAPSPSLPTPALPAPSLPAPSLPAPLPSPGVPAPSPVAPVVPVANVRGTGGSGSTSGPAALGGDGARDIGETGAALTVGSTGTGGRVSASQAGEHRPKGMSRQEWRKVEKRRWDRPLRGEQLGRLRERLLEHWSCADALSSTARRVLVMRAGLFGRMPAARRTIARRLGITLAGTLRVERTGLRTLARAGTCIDAGGAALGTNVFGTTANTSLVAGPYAGTGGDGSGTEPSSRHREPDRQGVLGETESGGPLARLRGGDDEHSALDPLLAFLAILLAVLLVATTVFGGRRVLPIMAARRAVRKPLLFLDIDGVLALRPPPGSLPPGAWEPLGPTSTYVSADAGAFIRRLAEGFDIVWASDWEELANPFFRKRLGLEDDLPTLTFEEEADSKSKDWKVGRLDEMAADRPLAWVDGTTDRAHTRWAAKRAVPTLVLQTDPATGLTEDHVADLLDFAESVADYDPSAAMSAGRARGANTLTRS